MSDLTQSLIDAYKATLVRIELTSQDLVVTTADLGTRSGPRPFDETVYIVTAWNPASQACSDFLGFTLTAARGEPRTGGSRATDGRLFPVSRALSFGRDQAFQSFRAGSLFGL